MKISRAIALSVFAAFAIVVHLFGWIAPLTPSEGVPSLVEIGIFYLFPIAALGFCGRAHTGLVRYLYFVLAALAALSYAYFYVTVMWQLF
jgi:hypothetical protein